MKSDLVPELVALGMTEREAKLYVAMMEKPEWKSGELHRLTGVPRPQTHQTLELMVSRQYCAKRSEGRYNYYRATSPDDLKEMLSRKWDDEVTLRRQRADFAFDILGGVFREAIKGDRSLDFIEIVQTPHRIHKRFIELMGEAKSGIVGFSRSPYSFLGEGQSRKQRDEQTVANESGQQKGLKNRMVFMYEADIWSFMVVSLERNVRNGVEDIRIAHFLPVKMFVFDENITMLAINSINQEQTSNMSQIIIYDKGIATICRDVFELYWRKAMPLMEWMEKSKE